MLILFILPQARLRGMLSDYKEGNEQTLAQAFEIFDRLSNSLSEYDTAMSPRAGDAPQSAPGFSTTNVSSGYPAGNTQRPGLPFLSKLARPVQHLLYIDRLSIQRLLAEWLYRCISASNFKTMLLKFSSLGLWQDAPLWFRACFTVILHMLHFTSSSVLTRPTRLIGSCLVWEEAPRSWKSDYDVSGLKLCCCSLHSPTAASAEPLPAWKHSDCPWRKSPSRGGTFDLVRLSYNVKRDKCLAIK